MDREIVHALLGLLDQRVAIEVPGEVLSDTAHLLERLVDRHGADRHRRVAQDPLARLVDVLAGGQVHHGVGAPAGRPPHLLDLLLDRGGHRRVADVGVDLHQEPAADDHRLGLRVVDVRGDDRAAPGDLVADDIGRHAFPQRDEFHLGGDLAAAGVVHLGHTAARLGPQRPPDRGEAHAAQRGIVVALATIGRGRPRQLLDVGPADDPGQPERGQALLDVDVGLGIGPEPAGVVQAQRRLAAVQADLAHGHAQIGTRAGHVDLSRRRLRHGASLRWY